MKIHIGSKLSNRYVPINCTYRFRNVLWTSFEMELLGETARTVDVSACQTAALHYETVNAFP